MDINLEYYKMFYYIGRFGGITAASEALSVSQPAVSQGLKQLEGAIGVPLFVRTPKGVRFTKEGEMLYGYIAKGYEQIKEGERQILQMLNLEVGELHIGASDMTLKYYLLPFLQRFHEQYSKIKITVTNGPTPETLAYLNEGKIDFGVVSAPIETCESYEIKRVRQLEDIFVAGGKFRCFKDKTLAFSELKKMPLLFLEENTSTRRYINEFLRKQGILLMPEFELATSDILVEFARKNMGVACVVRDFAEEYLESKELFELRFERPIPRRDMCIVINKRIPISQAATKLLSMLKRKGCQTE